MGMMTLAVLLMPPELWDNNNPIDVAQRHGRYLDAANKIERLSKVLEQVLVDAQSQDVLPEWWTVMQQALDA